MKYRCSQCGQDHDDLPDIGVDRPDIWWQIPEDERPTRLYLDSDTCVLDDEHFFIRGVIEIPILDTDDRFGFGVWVTQKKENFQTYLEHFDSDQIGPFFGWLSTRLSYYKEPTVILKTMAHFQSGNQRPRIEVEPSEHQLSIDQQQGITLEKAWEMAHFYLDLFQK